MARLHVGARVRLHKKRAAVCTQHTNHASAPTHHRGHVTVSPMYARCSHILPLPCSTHLAVDPPVMFTAQKVIHKCVINSKVHSHYHLLQTRCTRFVTSTDAVTISADVIEIRIHIHFLLHSLEDVSKMNKGFASGV